VLFNKPPATDTEPPKIETPDTSAEEEEYFGALFGQNVERKGLLKKETRILR